MMKCLLSYATSHYVVYLESQSNQDYLTFDELKAYLISHYNNLILKLNLDFENDQFEIYDQDFEQYVIVDKCTKIRNLSKLRILKESHTSNLDQSANNSLDKSIDKTDQNNELNKDNKIDKNYCLNEKNELSINLNQSNEKSINERSAIKNQTLNTSKDTSSIQIDEMKSSRVIHLKENPFKEHCLRLQTDFNRLIEENKRLNAKLELYKQGSVANATNYLDDFVLNVDTIDELRKKLVEAKEAQKTIMDAFKKKSKEFRRVVYLLTGFKFDALEQRKYRLSHIYSNPNDYLFFTFEKEEVINLLGNDFSEKFYDLINTYLVNCGSYPSFLASITIKLFEEKQDNLKKELK